MGNTMTSSSADRNADEFQAMGPSGQVLLTIAPTESLGNLALQEEEDVSNEENIDSSSADNIQAQSEDSPIGETDLLEDDQWYDDENVVENDDNDHQATNGALEEYFASIQNRLVLDGYPYEYKIGTFWINPPAPFFALRNNKLVPTMLYYPRVFLWLPHHLLVGGETLQCPTCNHLLEVKAYNKSPRARRVVDLDRISHFYIMSIRYRCTSRNCNLTINSYDARVLKQLPGHLAAEFPAYLTHKCAVSKTVGDLLRPCMQSAMGVVRFRRTLQELHYLRYDRLKLQYLNAIKSRRKFPRLVDMLSSNSSPLPFSRFSDRAGFAGYVPSAAYFCLIYTAIIDQLRPLMDKQMSAIGGQVLEGDHSFKIIKHMGTIGSAPIFTPLYTVCNEYEEIRLQQLVPTKSLSHLKSCFQQMLDSYRLYGHKEPELFFTDNVQGDRRFLEEVLPSLRHNIRSNNVIVSEQRNPRILKGIFHLMDMIKISRLHELAKEFLRRLCDALLVVDQDDRLLVERHLATKNLTWDYMLSTRPSWVLRRVKRVVPPVEDLYPVIENLFREYGPIKCPTTGYPLFDEEAWKQSANVLKAIEQGQVSDPPGFSLYFKIGHDKDNLPLYRCSRGTNSLEGGVGTANRCGHVHSGHYEPWPTETIQVLIRELGVNDNSNDRLVAATQNIEIDTPIETFGIGAFLPDLADSLNITLVETDRDKHTQPIADLSKQASTNLVLSGRSTANPKKQLYTYLANKQRSKYAIVPVHTQQELDLFRRMMEIYHQQQNQIDWTSIAQSWNKDHADGETIFYKTSEHIKSHYHVWFERKVATMTILSSRGIFNTMRQHLQSPSRARVIEPAHTPSPLTIPALSQIPSYRLNTWPIFTLLPQQPRYPAISGTHTPPRISPKLVDLYINSDSSQISNILVGIPKKSTRTCSICRDPSCKGFSLKTRCQYRNPSDT
ncbi:hypothetical protein EC973_003056 [Apophysomyces ossiformis]|uniref:DUF6729 domain-containing protein n=1 Tax=Apophysomyces ossiformis TaxID=679940 RepID=A0A8H7BIC4_9FUNG|nr:hypothetical protein EC973_003056 [Apophysomyces ossiformis]